MPNVSSLLGQVSGAFKLVKGKDVDIIDSTDGSGITLATDDLFLVNDISVDSGVATQDSTMKVPASVIKTFMDTTYSAGDGLDLSTTTFSVDLKANGGLVIESTEVAVDLGASSITGTLDVGDGGTGATTLTDGGVLLGSGSGAITAMAVLTDGQMIVGDGTTDPVAESGSVLRTSIGVGTGDTPVFAGLQADTNNTNTTTSTTKGLFVDYDHTEISASGQRVVGIGLDINMNCESITHVGYVDNTGVDIDMTAGDAGDGQTNVGVDISCLGADNNYHLRLKHDADNHCIIRTIANGLTHIETTDSDGESADINFNIDGDFKVDSAGQIDLDAHNNTINFKHSGLIGAVVELADAGARLNLYASSNAMTTDYFRIGTTDANAATTIATVDAAGANAHLTINPDGNLILGTTPGGSITLQENDGTGYTPSATTDAVHKKYADELQFATSIYNFSYRMGSVNHYYISNYSLGTSVTNADFGVTESRYAAYTAASDVVLKSWQFVGYVSSTEPYEIEIWDATIGSDGDTTASAVTQVGSTANLPTGGGNASSLRFYKTGATGLSYALAAGHQLYVVARYTDGSGSKTIYGTINMEFEVIS